MTHIAEVHGASVYDVTAASVAQFRREGCVDTLAPSTVLHVECTSPQRPTMRR